MAIRNQIWKLTYPINMHNNKEVENAEANRIYMAQYVGSTKIRELQQMARIRNLREPSVIERHGALCDIQRGAHWRSATDGWRLRLLGLLVVAVLAVIRRLAVAGSAGASKHWNRIIGQSIHRPGCSIGFVLALTIAAGPAHAQDATSSAPGRIERLQQWWCQGSQTADPIAHFSATSWRAPLLDEMVGQMIMVGVIGTSPDQAGVRSVMAQLKEGKIGGILLLGGNVRSPRQLRRLNRALSESARSTCRLPAFIGIDQEGGSVQRLTKRSGGWGFPFSARTIATRCSLGAARRLYQRAMACYLAANRINLTFGPVVDINRARNPIIGKLRRSYASTSRTILAYADAFISAHHAEGILVTAKHFPGHGSSLRDSHKGFTSIDRTWRASELRPFRMLSHARRGEDGSLRPAVDMMMVGHLYHHEFSDGRDAPATLSKRAIAMRLRQDLRFGGVVITDDLQMGAVKKLYPSLKDVVIRAVLAGNDILLFSVGGKKDFNLGRRVHGIIMRAVLDRRIDRARIIASYLRIRAAKLRLAERQLNAPTNRRGCASARELFKKLCRRGKSRSTAKRKRRGARPEKRAER